MPTEIEFANTLAAFVPRVVFFILALAGVLKLMTLKEFRDTLFAIPIVPHRFKPILAIAVPVYEILCGLLGLGWNLLIATWMALPLFCGFIFVALTAMRKSLLIECNCFGAGETTFGWSTVRNNLLLIAGLMFQFVGNHHEFRWYGHLMMIMIAGSLVLTVISLINLRKNWEIYFRLFRL